MGKPYEDETGQRFYYRWSGNPGGTPEDTTRCIEEVWPEGKTHAEQCKKPRGHGPDALFCKRHAAQYISEDISDEERLKRITTMRRK